MAASRILPEIEAKLLITAASQLSALAGLTELGPFRVRARDTVDLHSRYLDTKERILLRNGVALRVRAAQGQWEATAKWQGSVRNGVAERPELTVPLAGPARLPFRLPEGPLSDHLAALVAERPLRPILITDIVRQRFDIVARVAADDAPPLAELALDTVQLRGGTGHAPARQYREAEIECRHGKRRDVSAVVRLLRQQFGLESSIETKFAKGLTMLYGADVLAAPLPVPLHGSDTIADAARKTIGRYLQQLRACDPGTRLGEDPEQLHDMRVASRRLRAAVRAFRSGIPARLQAYLDQELKWLAQLLGSVRDLDVQIGYLAQYGAAAPRGHRDGLDVFRQHLAHERETCRSAMLAGLRSPRYCRLLLRMEHFAGSLRPRATRRRAADEPVAAVGRRALKEAFRRLLKRGRRIDTTPAPEDLHALRIRAKRLRYLLEFLQGITGKPGRRLVRRLVRLQDLLGVFHDRMVAAEFVRQYVEGSGAQQSPAALLTLGAFVSRELRLAEKQRVRFHGSWARFAGSGTLKELRAVRRHLERTEEAAQ